jgi:hypothetical protein
VLIDLIHRLSCLLPDLQVLGFDGVLYFLMVLWLEGEISVTGIETEYPDCAVITQVQFDSSQGVHVTRFLIMGTTPSGLSAFSL